MNPTSTPQQQQALQMMRAQLMAQQFQQSGQMPADNEMAGNVVVRHSPLEYLSRQVSQNMGNTQQLKAAQMQMQLMGQNMGGSGAAGGAGSGTGIDPSQLRKAAMYDVMYGAGSGKAYLDSLQPTPDMKNASASGAATPLDYNNKNAQNTATANAGMKPTTYTTPDGRTIQTTEAALAGMAGGQPPAGAPPAANVQPRLPLNATNNAMGGMGNPDVAPAGMPSGAPPAIPNGAAVPPVAPVQGASLPPPAGFAQANGSVPPQAGAMAPMAGFKDPSQAPPSIVPQQTAQNTSAVPFSQMVANSQPSASQGMQVQSPAQAAGATEAQKNYQTYSQGLNKKVSEGADNTRIMNAQEDLMTHFRPGAGEEDLAKAAAAIKTMGASDSLVNAVARGDQSAVGAVQAFSSMASIHAATQALEIMGSGSNGPPRIAASVLEEFKNNLSNPDKQESAIRAINALSRQQYQADFSEQQAALKDKGDPTTWQGRYAAQINPGLIAGRNTSPAEAITQTDHVAAPAMPPPTTQRTAGQIYPTPRGPMKWTGTGWLPNAQQ